MANYSHKVNAIVSLKLLFVFLMLAKDPEDEGRIALHSLAGFESCVKSQ